MSKEYQKGFEDGFASARKLTDETLINWLDRPRLMRTRNENGENVLKWIRPSEMEKIDD